MVEIQPLNRKSSNVNQGLPPAKRPRPRFPRFPLLRFPPAFPPACPPPPAREALSSRRRCCCCAFGIPRSVRRCEGRCWRPRRSSGSSRRNPDRRFGSGGLLLEEAAALFVRGSGGKPHVFSSLFLRESNTKTKDPHSGIVFVSVFLSFFLSFFLFSGV